MAHSLPTASASPCNATGSSPGMEEPGFLEPHAPDPAELTNHHPIHSLEVRALWTGLFVVHERGFQIRSDTIHPSMVLPGHGGAPLITRVRPHLVALSTDPRAPDVNCIPAPWLSGVVIAGQYREV